MKEGNMKYYILSKKDFKDYAEDLGQYMKNDLHLDVEISLEDNNMSYVKNIVKISKEIVAEGRNNMSLIMIDETGGLGFTASAKVKGMICAQISDEHSSHMTREHNCATAIALGANISSKNQIKLITKLFVEGNFSAGRHMVRIDMLDRMA